MNKKQALTIASVLLILLGVLMIYLGFYSAPKTLWPPVITGIGFFIIAWGFYVSK